MQTRTLLTYPQHKMHRVSGKTNSVLYVPKANADDVFDLTPIENMKQIRTRYIQKSEKRP